MRNLSLSIPRISRTCSRRLLLSVAPMLIAGCQGLPLLHEDDSSEYQPLALDYSLPETTSGGLYRAGYSGSLVRDRRALRVGDILTVVLDESTQSSKSAGTIYGKSSDVGIGVPTLFGKDYPDLETDIAAERNFNGSAKSSQQNTLRGAIAVTVHQVLPNGTLLVKGEKALRLNQGDEFIRLTGLVRLDDITRNNQVSSQNVANAKISYAGRGVLNDSNSAGWLSRFFASPLFPM
jgi:flagellar L-ring protein precursor FlgH